ncbi:MAG TPA: hypothetical protein VF702_15160 [Allosphingosinicella sp.]|jgi:hypothetical protein
MIRAIAMAAAAFSILACVPAAPRAPEVAPANTVVFARFGEEVRPGGVRVQPLRIVEDSRCPQSVQCVHAGTVRIAVRVVEGGAARETVLTLREPEPVGGGRVLRLVGVCPHAPAPGRPLATGAYRFQLTVDRDGEPVAPHPMCTPT